ncbi:biotin--[acetyl-CoA-carboxylase] ligase [Lacinutrix iliipiscaria]|uniref:Biotin--[acetyl-CoA-carboxylase] ligase n=1 Tax=Lacinutrix iliipiscaria TaxID=1230532 RepID=A0ABW5WKG7_9FLAO
MRIIKLNATNSTNTYLKQLSGKEVISDYTVVQTQFQTQGRGQMGTKWSANSGENLMFSVFKEVSFLKFDQHFCISMVTALAIIKTLKSFNVPKLSVKWPNDILSEDKKICGVLIENSIKQNKFKDSIIGVGINVNQTHFENLPKASSLRIITGRTFHFDELLIRLIEHLKQYFSLLEAQNFEAIKNEYESYLFRKNKPSTFKDKTGNMFSGFIQSVSETGNLQVRLEDAILKEYDLKEITLLY